MKTTMTILGILTALIAGPQALAADAQTIYVRAERAKLMEQARLGAKAVAEAARGTKLTVIAKEGTWYHVRTAAGTEGWISQAFTADQPVATLEGMAAHEAADSRSARRRGGRAATMGVRGLTRGAGKLDASDADTKALQKVEEDRVPAEDVRKYEQDLKKD